MDNENRKIDKEYYNRSDYYEKGLQRFSNLQSSFQKYRIKKISEIYTPSKEEKLLDLGCGWGTLSFAMAPLCKEVIGIDFSQKSIDICNNLLSEKNLPNVSFKKADACATGFPPDTFDVIISADLFEHVYPDDYERMMDECQRVLKKGGRLVIWTPHRGHILEIMKNHNFILKKDISHVDYKSMAAIIGSIKKRNMRVLKSYYAQGHIPVLNIAEAVLSPVLPVMRRRIAVLAQKPA